MKIPENVKIALDLLDKAGFEAFLADFYLTRAAVGTQLQSDSIFLGRFILKDSMGVL